MKPPIKFEIIVEWWEVVLDKILTTTRQTFQKWSEFAQKCTDPGDCDHPPRVFYIGPYRVPRGSYTKETQSIEWVSDDIFLGIGPWDWWKPPRVGRR
jgi:hypothetical protein